MITAFAPAAALDVYGCEARRLGNGKLPIVGGYEPCAPGCVRRRNVKQVKAASEVLRSVSPRKLPSLREHLSEIERNKQQPVAVKIVSKLPLDRAAFLYDKSYCGKRLESIHPNYFETFPVPILRGRAFTAADRAAPQRIGCASLGSPV